MVGRLCLAAGLSHVVLYASAPPSSSFLLLIAGVALSHRRLPRRWRPLARGLSLFALGALIGSLRVDTLAARQWPAAHDAQRVPLVYEVTSIPRRGSRSVSFAARVIAADCPHPACSRLRDGQIVISWYRPDVAPAAGQRYQGQVALRRPRSLVNPAASDGRAHLLGRGVLATASAKGEQQLLSQHFNRAVLRARLAERVLAGLAAERHWRALLIGDRNQLTDRDYVVLSRTGTAHLFAISGLHVGLVAAWCGGFGWLFGRGLALTGWSYRYCRWLPLLAGLAGAATYAALADFAVSTERALAATAVVIGARALGARPAPRALIATGLVVVALLEPLAWLQMGFWLSFGAVSLLVYGLAGRARGIGAKLLGAQGVLAVGMAAPSLALGLGISLAGLVVNALAVPLFSVAVVPGLMLGSLLALINPGWGGGLGWLDSGFMWLWQGLQWAAQAPLWGPSRPLSLTLLVSLGIGAVMLLAPAGLNLRFPGAALMLVAACGRPAPDFALRLTVLDVGQGLSLVVETPARALIYDAGPRGDRFDSGRRIVAPYLRSRGLRAADLVVSHADNDHAGGAPALVEELLTELRLGGEPLPGFAPCQRGRELHALGESLDITALWPVPAAGGEWPAESGNNASCVLLLSLELPERGVNILLAGDIDQTVERQLLGDLPPLDLLIAPHHGSASSSSWALLRHTTPRYAVFSTGYGNSYGHPSSKVIKRYAAVGSTMLNTAEHGALIFTWDRRGELAISRARDHYARSWH